MSVTNKKLRLIHMQSFCRMLWCSAYCNSCRHFACEDHYDICKTTGYCACRGWHRSCCTPLCTSWYWPLSNMNPKKALIAFYGGQSSDSLSTLHLQLFHQKVFSSTGSVQSWILLSISWSVWVQTLYGYPQIQQWHRCHIQAEYCDGTQRKAKWR